MQFNSRQNKDQHLATIDQALIHPDLSSPKSHFLLDIAACDGAHSFSLVIDPEKETFSMEDIQVANLDLAKVPFLQQTFGRKITGSLSGSGSYQGAWNTEEYPASGQGSMIITEGSFSLLFPVFSLKEINLSKMTTELVLEKNILQMNKGSFHGKELKGDFSGDMELQSPLKQSELIFEGRLEPLPPLLKTSKYARNMIMKLKKQQTQATFSFFLLGSLESPTFDIDS